MKCLNVIIFYDNRIEVESYINEVFSIAKGFVDIILVVNSDRDNQSEEMIKNLIGKGIDCVRVVNFGENVGYLNSMLFTIKDNILDNYKYIILSNTDIRYETKDFFQRLIRTEYPDCVGCIAPSVYSPQSNSYSNPHYTNRVSREKLESLVQIFKHPFLAKIYLRLSAIKAAKTKTEKQDSCYVYSPHGCYMIFTNAFTSALRGYEYGVKMYSEESAIGELLVKYGKKCFYDSDITVVHEESSVTGRMDYNRRFLAWRESIEYILQEFY